MANTPTGTRFFVATAFGTAKTFNDAQISNATEAVVTISGHGFTSGTPVLVSSGWGNLNGRVAEVTVIDANSVKLTKIDTSNTQLYTPNSGGGSLKAITTWTQLTKVLSASSSGGDPKTVSYKYLESDVEFSINDGFSATSYSLSLDDDDSTAGYAALRSLTDVQSDTAMKMLLRSGTRVYIPGRVALNDVPQLQDGQVISIKAALNGTARHSRFS